MNKKKTNHQLPGFFLADPERKYFRFHLRPVCDFGYILVIFDHRHPCEFSTQSATRLSGSVGGH